MKLDAYRKAIRKQPPPPLPLTDREWQAVIGAFAERADTLANWQMDNYRPPSGHEAAALERAYRKICKAAER